MAGARTRSTEKKLPRSLELAFLSLCVLRGSGPHLSLFLSLLSPTPLLSSPLTSSLEVLGSAYLCLGVWSVTTSVIFVHPDRFPGVVFWPSDILADAYPGPQFEGRTFSA